MSRAVPARVPLQKLYAYHSQKSDRCWKSVSITVFVAEFWRRLKEWEKPFIDGDKTDLQKAKTDDIMNFMDITNEWITTKRKRGTVTELQEYKIDGTTYKVDGKQVILRPTEQEREIAAILSGKYGKNVQFVPQIMYPQSIQTPDYLIDGEIKKQVRMLYFSRHTRFIEVIVLMKDGEILKVYRR